MRQPTLFDEADNERRLAEPPDQGARAFAVDPDNNVVLEASAGTGKTRVLVDRYVRLVLAGVEPRHILAMTFTRKAAAEMRGRVLEDLRVRAQRGDISEAAWRQLAERVGEIQISTIDAFCFALLREFPLEARVDPGFEIADETEMARFAHDAVELTWRAARAIVAGDECVRLLAARVRTSALVDLLTGLLDRRHIALPVIAAFVRRGRGVRGVDDVSQAFIRRVDAALSNATDRAALLDDGPAGAPGFRWVASDLEALGRGASFDPAAVRQLRRRLERYFLTQSGKPRQRTSKPIVPSHFASPAAKRRHEQAIAAVSPAIAAALERLDRDLDVLLARGLLRLFQMAVDRYERLLDEHALLDFAGMLDRAVVLLQRQEEFARSRLKLQARFHHLLVDEFQDTSRRQWQLIDLLIRAWGEGEGAADAPTSVFIVGDRKQSIYRFRQAEVTLLDEAADRIGALRPGRIVRQAITTSFRAVPILLAFVNALCADLVVSSDLDDRFRYDDRDRFPVPDFEGGGSADQPPALGLIAEDSMAASAAAVADEVVRLIGQATVRDRSGPARAARPDDIAILFRARAGHQYFEEALEARGVRTYVYKGLGFFDAPEVQDLQALIRVLALPDSDLRAAEFLRSRFVRLSDGALAQLAPRFAEALRHPTPDEGALESLDRTLLIRARDQMAGWLRLADRLPPSEVVDRVIAESAYAFELRGRRLGQARENVKKVRALIRRVENRGYTSLARLATYFDTLSAGDEANAVIDATGAVNLMTIHAAKGLEFPIVFLVNLHVAGRGRTGGVSVMEQGPDGEPEVAFTSTDATRIEERKEEEELRRLLYVAVTRARDRLYLGLEIDEQGRAKKGSRSLASLLPPPLLQAFSEAAASPDASAVAWPSGQGAFRFAVCRASEGVQPAVPEHVDDEPAFDAVPPLASGSSTVVPATVLAAMVGGATEPPEGPGPARAARRAAAGDERVIGRLVHRLFQATVDPKQTGPAIEAVAHRFLTTEDRLDLADPGAAVQEATRLYQAFRARPDVASLFEAGQRFYEVPFSYELADQPGTVIRGVVDCLVVQDDGQATVLEFKTGEPTEAHETQARTYARAVGAALGVDVRSRVLYA